MMTTIVVSQHLRRRFFSSASSASSVVVPRIVYLNGAFVPETEAKISCLDRGFLFSDGVYEVTAVLDGGRVQVDVDGHFARLRRSLSELRIDYPSHDTTNLEQAQTELIERNNLQEGIVYLQVTRGVAAERDFFFPSSDEPNNKTLPTVFMMTQSMNITNNKAATTGIAVVTVPDIRWKRRDIKTIGLLAQVLAKQEARDSGADDAWMVDDQGFVTEGASNNAFIVVNGKLITRALSNDILHGITRKAVLQSLETTNNEGGDGGQTLQLEERGFTVEEAYQADEAFSTSASSFVMPVVKIDGRSIGDGKPGPVTRQLRKFYLELALAPSSTS